MRKGLLVLLLLGLLVVSLVGAKAQAQSIGTAGVGCGVSLKYMYEEKGPNTVVHWWLLPGKGFFGGKTTVGVRLTFAVNTPLPIFSYSNDGRFLGYGGPPKYLAPDPWPPTAKPASFFNGWTYIEYVHPNEVASGYFVFPTAKMPRNGLQGTMHVGSCGTRFFMNRYLISLP